MKIQAVIGANYGDEGKGLVSGCLAREASRRNEKTLTIFYNGTTQRAHTFEGEIHRAMAAGTKYGSDTFYNSHFVIDPISLWILQAKPIIDPLCRIILPCDVMINRRKENERGVARHGSCGFGLFEAVTRSRKYCVSAKDLKEPYILYRNLLAIGEVFPTEYDDLYNLDNFMKAAAYITRNCQIRRLREIAGNYDTIIYEGGQGLLLDQGNMDCFPHLTPSSTGCRNIADDIYVHNLCPESVELYYVSRSYLTRHGAGPMAEECGKDDINPLIIDNTNEENEWQGALRFGKLDLDVMASKICRDTVYLRNDPVSINMVYTQLNYTGGELETINGKEQVRTAFHADHIYVSDQKDMMEMLR